MAGLFRKRAGTDPETAPPSSVEDLDLDEFALNVLDVARHFLISLAVPESLAWVEAIRRAECAFPPPYGATIASAILVAVQETQISRFHRSRLRVALHTPDGAAVTNEERYFIEAFQDIRKGRHSRAYANALMLCEGVNSHAFLAALERLAVITGEVDALHYNAAV
ncbi:MAG: hypothetical protein AAGK37_09890 [Pseudomonadota bacterium]